MTLLQFRRAFTLLLIASGAIGAPDNSHNEKGPKPGPHFPALEPYYPVEARRAFQEGTTMVHLCVDPNGRLSSPPTVAASSGIGALDSAAVNVANAGNGLYLPGTVDGVPHEVCGELRINFVLRADPLLRMANFRLPTVTARLEALITEYNPRLAEIEKTVDKPTLDLLPATDPETVRAIRQYALGLDAALDQMVGIVADLLDTMGTLGQSPDIPESERTVFLDVWPNERLVFMQKFRKTLGDSRNMVRSLDELADYVSFSNLRRPKGEPADKAQTPSQDFHLVEIRGRALNALRKLQGSLEILSKGPPATENDTH